MKAIFTKYIGPTNTRGARIKAYAEGGNSIIVGYSYTGDEHSKAALALCAKMGWKGTLVSGGRADGKGDVFCFLASDQYAIPEQVQA